MSRKHLHVLAGLVVLFLGSASVASADEWSYYADVQGTGNVELMGGRWGTYEDAANAASVAQALGSRVTSIVNVTTGAQYRYSDNTPPVGTLAPPNRPSAPPFQDRLEKARKSYELVKEAYQTLRDAKEAVDKAKDFVKNGFTAKERELGAALKEYSDRVTVVFDDATKLKGDMSSMTGTITQKQFGEVNKLIDNINSSNSVLDAYRTNSYGAKFDSMPTITRLTTSTVMPSQIAGRVRPAPATQKLGVTPSNPPQGNNFERIKPAIKDFDSNRKTIPAPYNPPSILDPFHAAVPSTSPAIGRVTPNIPSGRAPGRIIFDDSQPKLSSPKGVSMRVGIDQSTLQRAEAPPALFNAIRATK